MTGKTAVWVVAVNNYMPELCAITFPNLKAFASRIGADFNVIEERKFNSFPPTYEKLQVYELGKTYEWNILIDADMIVHPDLPDPRVRTGKNALGIYYGFDARIAFNRITLSMQEYARKYGIYRGIVTNFIVSHAFVHEVWKPLGVTFDDCDGWCCRNHILDEYTISQNVSTMGIPCKPFLLASEQSMVYHICAEDRKVNGEDAFNRNVCQAKQLIKEWN